MAKSEFGCAQVSYLRHTVGQVEVKPIDAKVKLQIFGNWN